MFTGGGASQWLRRDRTPGGGSSKQTLIFVKKNDIRTRLLGAREAARLMGLPDTYKIPEKYTDSYYLFGDGLAVPVVAWLTNFLLEPLARCIDEHKRKSEKRISTDFEHWMVVVKCLNGFKDKNSPAI
ncbi:MAG: hypothetical protein EOO38_20380 [Cytophagaceae bacterium]|nr:MAG: hypothetical protein EOO38_20380 [Cytophagaceae bacterium]